MISKERGFTLGLMVECLRANGGPIKCTVKV